MLRVSTLSRRLAGTQPLPPGECLRLLPFITSSTRTDWSGSRSDVRRSITTLSASEAQAHPRMPVDASLDELLQRRAFLLPNSAIYGGYAHSLDFGPYGALLKRILRELWWREFVETRDEIEPMDTSTIMSPRGMYVCLGFSLCMCVCVCVCVCDHKSMEW
jgi:hypothetical protein